MATALFQVLWYVSTLHLGDVMGYRYSLIAKVFEWEWDDNLETRL